MDATGLLSVKFALSLGYPILVTNGLIVFALSFLLAVTLTYLSMVILRKWKRTVADFHKPDKPQVPRPGGPAIVASIVAGELLIYYMTGSPKALVLVPVTLIASSIGLLDDFVTLKGYIKPLAMVIAALPILLIGTYDFYLSLPLFGHVRLSIVYPLLILLAIPVTANTINTIDVMNGAVSASVAIATIPLLFVEYIRGDFINFLIILPLTATTSAFYLFHRYPSKIFPGDSGTLVLGAAFGALAIVAKVEVVAVIALLPAILNSFFFLSSVRRIIEHRGVKTRPIEISQDYKLSASRDRSAPITLVRLLLADGPLGERQVAGLIIKLFAFSALLASITALVN